MSKRCKHAPHLLVSWGIERTNESLQSQLKMVLDRESASQIRHDAKCAILLERAAFAEGANKRLEAENARLREALKPFGDAAKLITAIRETPSAEKLDELEKFIGEIES